MGDEIKRDFTFGFAFFSVPGVLVANSFLECVAESGIISPFSLHLTVNSTFVSACRPTVGGTVNCSFSRRKGLKELCRKSFEPDVENLTCGFSMNGAASSPLRYAMNAGSV